MDGIIFPSVQYLDNPLEDSDTSSDSSDAGVVGPIFMVPFQQFQQFQQFQPQPYFQDRSWYPLQQLDITEDGRGRHVVEKIDPRPQLAPRPVQPPTIIRDLVIGRVPEELARMETTLEHTLALLQPFMEGGARGADNSMRNSDNAEINKIYTQIAHFKKQLGNYQTQYKDAIYTVFSVDEPNFREYTQLYDTAKEKRFEVEKMYKSVV